MRHRRGRALRRRYGRAQSMSFGIVPPFAEFVAHIRSEDPDEGRPYLAAGQKYPMELTRGDQAIAARIKLKPSGTGDYGKMRYALTDKQLHSALKKLVALGYSDKVDESTQQDAESLASSIMTTLGYEWI